MNIFIADDDQIIRKGLRSIIEKSDLNCTVVGEASDGELALQEMAECGKVDLLITDIRMPIMDGLELIKKIKEQNLLMKVIVLSGYDEFKYIRNAFVDGAVDYLLKPINKKDLVEVVRKTQEAIEQDAARELNRKESHQILAANTLKQIFHIPAREKEEEEKLLGKIGLNLENSYYFVMVCRIDNYYKQNMERMIYEGALEVIYDRMEDAIREIQGPHVLQYINNTEIVYLVYSEEELDANAVSEHIYAKVCEVHMEDTTYTLGVGNVYHGLSGIRRTYQEAQTAADARFYLGKNHRIEYHEIESKLIDINYNLEPLVEKLTQYIELYDYINCKKLLEQTFLDLCYLTPLKFRKYMKDMLELLILRVKDFQEAVLCCAYEYGFFLENINTYNELRTYMSYLIKDVIEYIRSEREKRSKNRIELAKKYISEHYKDNITLNDLAEYVELNASYFSNLFKTEVGTNFSDYLLEVRMRAARTLLRDPTIKVYEIGCMVGYEDAVSFGRAFKKSVGISPKEYRNTVY
ncbi:two-component system response regulator YesN [Anaerotaenia torta]|uniref:response regulator n=1 Tax=Anaerotaenia torta TaxID=433293 RepID=UPI003D1E279F